MSEIIHSSLKKTVKGSSFVFMGTAISMVIWFVLKILIIRNTTKAELGLYSLAVAIAGLFSIFANAGINSGATRFVSIFLGEGRKEDARLVAVSAMSISTVMGLAGSALLFLSSGLMAGWIFYMPEIEMPFKAVAAFVFFQVTSRVIVSVLNGYSILKPNVYYVSIGQPLASLVLIGACLYMKLPFISIIYAYSLAIAVSWVALGVSSYRYLGIFPFSLKRGGHARTLIEFSLPIVIGSASAMIMNWMDSIILGRYMGAEAVGAYSICTTLTQLLTFAYTSAAFVYMPIAGDMYSKGQSAELKKTYQVLTKWVFSLTLPLFLVMFMFPEMTISFLFNKNYPDIIAPTRLLALGLMFNVFMGTNSLLLIVMGKSKVLMHIATLGTVLNLFLNYLFIKQLGWGLNGAALATMIAYVLPNIVVSVILHRQSGIHPFTLSYIRPLVGISLVSLVVYAVAKLLPMSLWMLPIYFAIFIAGYTASLFLTRSIEAEDLFMLDTISKRVGIEMTGIKSLVRRFVKT